MNHYHIRWFNKTGQTLDWERFGTAEEAKDAAKRLVLPGEDYTVEQFDGNCARCAESSKRATSRAAKTESEGPEKPLEAQPPRVQLR
jgi:hypothetical protein